MTTLPLPRPALFHRTATRARHRLRLLWLRELAKVDIIVEAIMSPAIARAKF